MSDPLNIEGPAETVTPLAVTSVDNPDPNPPAPEPVAEPQSVRADTAYIVLALGDDPDIAGAVWKVVATQLLAKSTGAACQQYAETIPDSLLPADGLVLIAIPARSWKPVRIKPQTVTTLIVEDA